MLTLKFFGLVIIFVALMNVILALVKDDNGRFTDDYDDFMCIFDETQPCNFCGLCSALHMNIRESEDDVPSAQPEITLESAIDYLHSIGWIQEHDRIMAESAQPERKTGRWIRGGAYPHHIFCSACYATYVPNDEWDIWKADGTYCWRLPRQFCPNCGAKMDKEGAHG